MSYSYRIEQAIRAASVLHKDQVRRGQTPFPYITHLFAVAMLVADYTQDEDTIIAALLHDTLEDTDYTADELADDFGEVVKDIVLALTESKYDEEPRKSWKERKAVYLKKLGSAPESALIVSAADKIHNMRCIIEEYYGDGVKFHADFGGSLEDRLMMYQEISNTLNRRLQSQILHEFNHVFDEYKNFITNAKKEIA